METIKFKKGDIVCRKRKYGREYLRVVSALGKNITCSYLGKKEKQLIMFPKKEAYKYNVGTITLRPDMLKRLVSGETHVVYGPASESWLKICVSMTKPIPDVMKIYNGYKGWAIFQYVEAARVYVAEYINVRLEVGELLEQEDV